MAWAVTASDRRPVYVGTLPREQKGLSCCCICPACGAFLQAVGVGLNGVRPYFRHNQSVQDERCRFRVAEVITLAEILKQGYIDLPGPKRAAAIKGASGAMYLGQAMGASARERVVGHTLVSEVAAVLQLESGRTVLLSLRGELNLNSVGAVSAHVVIQCDDPEVALLSQDEVSERVRLQGYEMCVQHHWLDEEAQRLAEEDARRKALESLDPPADDAGELEGATPEQRAESALHQLVKWVLAKQERFTSPEHRIIETASRPGLGPEVGEIYMPARELAIHDVREEVGHDGYRPDIVCQASDPGVAPWMPATQYRLLIEVAVTHKVEEKKLGRIVRDDLPCIELDMASLALNGRVTLSEIEDLVRDGVAGKRWLHFPGQDALKAEAARLAQAKLDSAQALRETQQRQAQERLAREQAEQERRRQAQLAMQADREARRTWLLGLDEDSRLRECRSLLEVFWFDTPGAQASTSNGMLWVRHQFEEIVVDLLPEGLRHEDVRGDHGALRTLSSLLQGPRDRFRMAKAKAVAAWAGKPRILRDDWASLGRTGWDGLFHLVIERLNLAVPLADAREWDQWHQQVLESLHAGKAAYIRGTDRDAVLAGMYPEIAAVLREEIGTKAYCTRIAAQEAKRKELEDLLRSQERAEEDARQAELRRQEQEAEAVLEQQRKVVRDLAEAQMEKQWLARARRWRPLGQPPRSLEQVKKYARRMNDPKGVVISAYEARQQGVPFAQWIEPLKFSCPQEVYDLRKLLEDTWLLV